MSSIFCPIWSDLRRENGRGWFYGIKIPRSIAARDLIELALRQDGKPPGVLARVGDALVGDISLAIVSNTELQIVTPSRYTSRNFVTSILKHLGNVGNNNDIAVTIAVLVVPVHCELSDFALGVVLEVALYGLPSRMVCQLKAIRA